MEILNAEEKREKNIRRHRSAQFSDISNFPALFSTLFPTEKIAENSNCPKNRADPCFSYNTSPLRILPTKPFLGLRLRILLVQLAAKNLRSKNGML